MIDQDHITARVVSRLEAEGLKLHAIPTEELWARIAVAAREACADSPVYPVVGGVIRFADIRAS